MKRPYSAIDSKVRRTIVRNSGLRSADEYVYPGKGDSKRQMCFYRILSKMHKESGRTILPVVIPDSGGKWRLDIGSTKMAETQGVIRKLKNAPTGVVETVELVPSRLAELGID